VWTVIAGPRAAIGQNAQVPQLPQLRSTPNLPTIQVGPPATPAITSQKSGATVGSPIVVKGTAGHGMKITVTATLTVAVPISGMSTQLGEGTATANAKGNWQVSITPKIPVKISTSSRKIELEAIATNPTTDQKSAPAKVEVVPHG